MLNTFLYHYSAKLISLIYCKTLPLPTHILFGLHFDSSKIFWKALVIVIPLSFKGKIHTYLILCSYHVTNAFQSESTLYNCLNIKELLARNRRNIWGLSDYNGTWAHNHLVCRGTLNHLAKLAKWLSCVVRTYLYGAFGCMFLSCHIRISEWIHTL